MFKHDEIALMRLVTANDGRFPSALWEEMRGDRSWPRATYLLTKWERKGWWEYGVSLRSGWLTAEGYERVQQTLAQQEYMPPGPFQLPDGRWCLNKVPNMIGYYESREAARAAWEAAGFPGASDNGE